MFNLALKDELIPLSSFGVGEPHGQARKDRGRGKCKCEDKVWLWGIVRSYDQRIRYMVRMIGNVSGKKTLNA